MVKRLFFFSVVWTLFTVGAIAQETLNIHSKSKGTVSIPFSKKPELTFGKNETLTVVSDELTVDYPFSDVEKLTFTNSSVDQVGVIRHATSSSIYVYNLSGVLIREYKANGEENTLEWRSLPKGTYIVKDGERTYKIVLTK